MDRPDDERIAADAALLSAAPDLLDALKAVMSGFDCGAFVRDISNDDRSDWAIRTLPYIMALKSASLAIAKAEGAA